MKLQLPVIIDGGLSNVLEADGYDLNHPLWSAKLLEENPGAIIDAHIRYLKAGAQVIITSSYQASIQGLMQTGMNEEAAKKTLLYTVHLAKESCTVSKRAALIAASIGPYGAFLSDGSEYKGNYGLTVSELESFHTPQFSVLDDSEADFYACETIPSFIEARALSNVLKSTKKPGWLSFSCKDDKHINDGTAIADCAALLENNDNILAMGVNCTHPKYVSGLIREIKKEWSGLIVVYPNSGEVFEPKTKTWLNAAATDSFAQLSERWFNDGADFIGGCCRIGPAHIQEIASRLKAGKL